MIVRILQLEVRPDKMDQFLKIGPTRVRQGIEGADGLLDMEILLPESNQGAVLVISRWRDEEAIKTWAGPMWRVRPVLIDTDLADYLAHSSLVSHYVPFDAPGVDVR
jgi:hypothetical protein